MGPREVLLAAVLPAVVALAALIGIDRISTPAKSPDAADRQHPGLGWGVALLGSVGAVFGSWIWQTRVDLWAEAVTHRFPAIALVAGVAGLVAALTPLRGRPVLAALPALPAGGLVAWAVLGGLHESLISEPARWGWIAGVAFLAAAQAWAIEAAARALPGWRGPGLLWLVTSLVALGATAGFASAPLVLWPVAAVLAAAAVVGLWRPANLVAGAGATLAVLLAGTVSFSHWFGDRERWVMFGLLIAAPLTLALCAAPVLRSRPRARLAVGLLALAMAGAQAAVSVAALLTATSADEYTY